MWKKKTKKSEARTLVWATLCGSVGEDIEKKKINFLYESGSKDDLLDERTQ